MSAAPSCACGSGRRYRECCRPYHRGEAEPADAPTLVRARFCAFAEREVGFLWRTLHPRHPDRARPEAEVLAELRRSAQSVRFGRLHLLDASPVDAEGLATVLFWAELFEKGKDRGFVERSEFRHDGVGWRYLSGETRPAREFGPAIQGLRMDSFLAAAKP